MPMYFTNSYSYNLAGNRTSAVLKGVSSAYTTPAAHNRLASWTGGGSMTYNAAGCVTALNRANKVDITSLSWDCEYQLTNVVAGATTVRYTYDVAGRKASRTEGGVSERYLYDSIHVVADTDNSGSLLRTYTYGPGVDNILSMTIHGSSGTTNYYYLKDLANTVLALANSSGSIVESYFYDAYGNVTILNGSGTVISASAYGNRFLFQGREYDYTTQLYHFRARWYDPETGRWLSNDPIGISGGLNLYAFCGNDPVNYVDPMGWAIVGNEAGIPIIVAGGIGSGKGHGGETGHWYYSIVLSGQEGGGAKNKLLAFYSYEDAKAALIEFNKTNKSSEIYNNANSGYIYDIDCYQDSSGDWVKLTGNDWGYYYDIQMSNGILTPVLHQSSKLYTIPYEILLRLIEIENKRIEMYERNNYRGIYHP
jgi:RHS repeat-associated protein